jgi:PAS domain S-box-containing protein
MTDLPQKLSDLEIELQAARHRLELTLEAAGAVCSWDWNVESGRLTGDARFAEITGQDTLDIQKGVPTGRFFSGIHPDDLPRVRLAVAGILAGAEIFSKDYRLLKRDGGLRWVHAQGRAVLDENDEPIRFVGTLIDITDQKQTQERLRIAQEAGGVGTFEHLVGFATVSVSDQLCRLFGLHPTKVLPVQTLNGMIHSDDPLIVDLSSPNQPQSELDREFRITRADDGQQRWLAQRGEYVDDLQGTSSRYIGVVYDITDAKLVQHQLREANAALAERARDSMRERNRIWENSRDLLLVLDDHGYVKDINPVWEEIFGFRAEDVVGKPFGDVAWPDDTALFGDALDSALQGTQSDFELRLRHVDGSARWISWRTSRDGETVYGFGRDVTVERGQAQTLKETEEQLRQSQKMEVVGQLTGGIAHDFNNMLTGIIGAMAIVRRRIAAGRLDDVDRFIDAATNSAQRAAALTHRLLAFSRRQSLDRQATDIRELVISMEDLLRRTLGEQVALSIVFSETPLKAMTDANQLENALLNLAINARDAMPGGGQLTIEADNVLLAEADILRSEEVKPGSYTVISVTDTGTGMSRETMGKAFEPFFTTKPIGQGTGLGLSMIYGFAQQSGGHVRLSSEIGKGTTIKLYLPSAESTANVALMPSDAEQEPAMGHGETVLVVEDDSSVRLLVIDVLNELGYQTIEAEDGNVALPIIDGPRRIDLLISDVGLPGINGRQLAEMAIARRPELKVLFITGYAATAASRAEFLAPGMEMITKPFAMDDLAAKVRDILTK